MNEPPKKSRWEKLLDALDDTRTVIVPEEDSGSGAKISREKSNDTNGYAIWSKRFEIDSSGETLAIFNEWESLLIGYVGKVPRLYRAAASSRVNTALAPSKGGRFLEIQTVDAGPDLGIWGLMNLRVFEEDKRDRRLRLKQRPHAFHKPVNYLRLARELLQALENLHKNGLIHCDIYPKNLVLPVDAQQIDHAEFGEGFRIKPKWEDITIIDLGFSVSKKVIPWVTLPLNTHEKVRPHMSIHLRKRLIDIENQAMAYLKAQHSDKQWHDVWVDRKFWDDWEGSPLSNLTTLDWREDLYALGYLLRKIRDGKNAPPSQAIDQKHRPLFEADGKTPQWRPPCYTWEKTDEGVGWGHAELNRLIYGTDDAPGLAEQLMAWGNEAQWGKRAPPRPHEQWIAAIDAALRCSKDEDADGEFYLYRIDHDAEYGKARQNHGHSQQHTGAGYAHNVAEEEFDHAESVTIKPPGKPSSMLALLLSAISRIRNAVAKGLTKVAATAFHLIVTCIKYLMALLAAIAIVLESVAHGIFLFSVDLLIFLMPVATCSLVITNPHITGFAAIATFIYGLVGSTIAFSYLRSETSNTSRWRIIKLSFIYPYSETLSLFDALHRRRWLYPILALFFVIGIFSHYDSQIRAWQNSQQWEAYPPATAASQRSAWWLKGQPADAAVSAWLQSTRQLAEQGMPQARFMAAYLRCYGMQDGATAALLSQDNAAACGPLLSAALQQGMQQWPDGDSAALSAMLMDTWELLKTVYKKKPPGAAALLQTLAPGLAAVAPLHDELAYMLADIQACWLKPAQKDAARLTLQALQTRSPTSAPGTQAGEDLRTQLANFCS